MKINRNGHVKKTANFILSFVNVVAIIYLLKLANWNYGIRFCYLPKLSDLGAKSREYLTDVGFYQNIFISVGRVYSGFMIAMLLAIGFAILIEESFFCRSYIYPVFEIIRPIPNAAWVPLSILLFPTIESSVIYITFIGAFFPILINTLDGLDQVNVNYKNIAKSFHVSKAVYIIEVLLPAALPNIFTGLLLGMSGAWLGVVIAEMISGQSGIGYLTWTCYTLVDVSGVMIGMLVIGTLGALSSLFIRFINRRFFPWTSAV